MFKVKILPLAKEDIRQASLWYNQQQKGLGNRFTKDVRETINFIKRNPKASNVRYDDVRTTVLSVFPFMIHYIIDKQFNTIIISAVLHTSQDTNTWKKR